MYNLKTLGKLISEIDEPSKTGAAVSQIKALVDMLDGKTDAELAASKETIHAAIEATEAAINDLETALGVEGGANDPDDIEEEEDASADSDNGSDYDGSTDEEEDASAGDDSDFD